MNPLVWLQSLIIEGMNPHPADTEVVTCPCNILSLRGPYLLRLHAALARLQAFDSDFGIFDTDSSTNYLKKPPPKHRKPKSKSKAPQNGRWLNEDDSLATPGYTVILGLFFALRYRR